MGVNTYHPLLTQSISHINKVINHKIFYFYNISNVEFITIRMQNNIFLANNFAHGKTQCFSTVCICNYWGVRLIFLCSVFYT